MYQKVSLSLIKKKIVLLGKPLGARSRLVAMEIPDKLLTLPQDLKIRTLLMLPNLKRLTPVFRETSILNYNKVKQDLLSGLTQ